MLRRPTYEKPNLEKPLVERLVEALDRAVAQRAEGSVHEVVKAHIDPPAPTALPVLLEHDPLEAFGIDSDESSEQMRAPISQTIDPCTPAGAAHSALPPGGKGQLDHLPYGGMPSPTQPKYRTRCQPEPGRIFKTQKRFELLARLENAGISDSQISSMLCISVPRVRQLKRSKDYLRARIKITHGLILDQDLALEQIKEQRRDILREMLPPALQVIANAVLNRPTCFAEAKLQVSVAQDILDREGTFAKISRSEVKPVEHFDWEPADASASQIVSLMRGAIGTEGTTVRIGESRTAKLIEISKAFTAGSNISPEEAIASAKMLEDAEPPEGWAPEPEARNGR